jgi:hypothetical protein
LRATKWLWALSFELCALELLAFGVDKWKWKWKAWGLRRGGEGGPVGVGWVGVGVGAEGGGRAAVGVAAAASLLRRAAELQAARLLPLPLRVNSRSCVRGLST